MSNAFAPRQAHGVRAREVVVVDDVARIRAAQRGLVALRPAAPLPAAAGDVRTDDIDAIRVYLRGPAPARSRSRSRSRWG